MKKFSILTIAACLVFSMQSRAQIDLRNIDLRDIIGKVMYVEKGFSPDFRLGNTPIQKISKVAEILGLKKNDEVNRLFNTFRTGRTIYKVASYAGGAIVVYGLARKLDNSIKSQDYEASLYAGLGAIASGLAVKLLTKGASYKAVDIFNDIAVNKIKDIFSIGPASSTAGIGIYVKL